MITDWETNFTDLQANDSGHLGKNNSGSVLVGNHAVVFTEINSPRVFFRSVMFVWTMVEAPKPTQNPEIPKKNRVYANFFEKFARTLSFCPLACDTSQEPNGNCSEKLAR